MAEQPSLALGIVNSNSSDAEGADIEIEKSPRVLLEEMWAGAGGGYGGKFVEILSQNLKKANLADMVKTCEISLEDIMDIAEVSEDQLSEFVTEVCENDSRCPAFVQEVMKIVNRYV